MIVKWFSFDWWWEQIHFVDFTVILLSLCYSIYIIKYHLFGAIVKENDRDKIREH